MKSLNRHITVLGAGLSGLAAAQRAMERGISIDVYEAKGYVGGHATSHKTAQEFVFDEGPHVSFTKNETIQHLFAEAIRGEYKDFQAEVANYWQGYWLPHPAQCHLYGLPATMVTKCIVDMIESQSRSENTTPANYAQWCRNGLGNTFSEQFTFAYTRKYWTAEAEQLSTDWVGQRVYTPKLDEVIRGALEPVQGEFHYITQFRYPRHGGFGGYVAAVNTVPPQLVHLHKRVEQVDNGHKKITFADGSNVSYDFLISSLPIPELIRMMTDVPDFVRAAAHELVCTSVLLVNISLDRAQGFPGGHWFYVYDEDKYVSRVHYPHRLAASNAPTGCGSIQAEIYYSRFRPLPLMNIAEKAVEELRAMRVILPEDTIRDVHTQTIPYANVLFTNERERALRVVTEYLANQRIRGCGRYGEWKYYWTDDSILSGWRASDDVYDSLLQEK